MVPRIVLAGLALCSGLAVSGAANAQYYGRPYEGGRGGYYESGPRYGRWDCNPSRCIDRRTGDLWESHCDRRGCVPLRPARDRGYGRGYDRGYDRGYGGWRDEGDD